MYDTSLATSGDSSDGGYDLHELISLGEISDDEEYVAQQHAVPNPREVSGTQGACNVVDFASAPVELGEQSEAKDGMNGAGVVVVVDADSEEEGDRGNKFGPGEMGNQVIAVELTPPMSMFESTERVREEVLEGRSEVKQMARCSAPYRRGRGRGPNFRSRGTAAVVRCGVSGGATNETTVPSPNELLNTATSEDATEITTMRTFCAKDRSRGRSASRVAAERPATPTTPQVTCFSSPVAASTPVGQPMPPASLLFPSILDGGQASLMAKAFFSADESKDPPIAPAHTSTAGCKRKQPEASPPSSTASNTTLTGTTEEETPTKKKRSYKRKPKAELNHSKGTREQATSREPMAPTTPTKAVRKSKTIPKPKVSTLKVSLLWYETRLHRVIGCGAGWTLDS